MFTSNLNVSQPSQEGTIANIHIQTKKRNATTRSVLQYNGIGVRYFCHLEVLRFFLFLFLFFLFFFFFFLVILSF